MTKEEIFTLIETLAEDQDKYNKFKEYILEFTKGERCKKGVLEFVHDLYNSKNVDGLAEMAITLHTDKTWRNSDQLRTFVFDHKITLGYVTALKDQRLVLMTAIAKYIHDTSERIQAAELDDKPERQVYLRRAVARLLSILGTNARLEIDTAEWAEIEPNQDIDYLCSTLTELTNIICDPVKIKEWADAWGDVQSLHYVTMLRSLRTYLNYLDTFTEF